MQFGSNLGAPAYETKSSQESTNHHVAKHQVKIKSKIKITPKSNVGLPIKKEVKKQCGSQTKEK